MEVGDANGVCDAKGVEVVGPVFCWVRLHAMKMLRRYTKTYHDMPHSGKLQTQDYHQLIELLESANCSRRVFSAALIWTSIP